MLKMVASKNYDKTVSCNATKKHTPTKEQKSLLIEKGGDEK